jgi:hypothetical protein
MTPGATAPAPAQRRYTALFGWEPDHIGEMPIAVHVLGADANEAVDSSHAALRAHLAARTDAPTDVLMRQVKFTTVLLGHCSPASNEGIIIAGDGSPVSAADGQSSTADSPADGARRIDVSYSRLYSTSADVPAHLDGQDLTDWLERHADRWHDTGELVDLSVESWEDPDGGADGRWQR